MLHLLNNQHMRVGSFKTFDEIVVYIHHVQTYNFTHLNILGPSSVQNSSSPQISSLEDTQWRFVHYKHAELAIIYSGVKEISITGIEKEAFDLGLDLIEIHHGSSLYPAQLPVTPDLDIESLKKEWCESYCHAHGLRLVEGVSLSTTEEGGPL